VDTSAPQPVPNPRRTILTPDGKLLRRPMIDDPELEAMREGDRARDAALDAFTPEGWRRLRIHVLGACVFFPLARFVLVSGDFGALWLQLPLAAAFGAFVALARPGPALCSVSTILVGVLIESIGGTPNGPRGNFYLLLAMILYGTAGFLIGSRESDKQLDR